MHKKMCKFKKTYVDLEKLGCQALMAGCNKKTSKVGFRTELTQLHFGQWNIFHSYNKIY